MGSLTLAYPSIAGKTTQEQLESMRRYLCGMAEQLNLADWSARAALTEIAQAIDADGLSEEEKKTTLSGYAALKSLIIKTADFAAANSEVWSAKLAGNYVAASDFGTYLEKTQLTIEGNSVGIKQLYDYTAGVNNAFSVNAQQYIKTGLLYYNDVTPVYGVGVGNIETTVTDGGGRIVDRTKNELLTVTPKRISFWQEGMEVAYLSEKKLHFPSGTLEAYNAKLTGTITAAAGSAFGPWTIADGSIYRVENAFGSSAGTRGESRKGDLDIALPCRMHAGRLAASKHQAEEDRQHAKRHDTAAHCNDNARHGVTHQQHKAVGIWPPKLADKRTQRHDGGGKIHDR